MSFTVGSAVVVLVGQGQERAWHAAHVVDLFTGGLRASLDGTSFTVPIELHNVMPHPDADLLRRDWAVRVLDAWAKAGRARAVTAWDNFTAGAELFDGTELRNDGRKFEAATPDAVRLAAAEAVWPELPESARAEIGERP